MNKIAVNDKRLSFNYGIFFELFKMSKKLLPLFFIQLGAFAFFDGPCYRVHPCFVEVPLSYG